MRLNQLGAATALVALLAAAGWLVQIALGPEADASAKGEAAGLTLEAVLRDSSLAVTEPDRFNWTVFALINQPANNGSAADPDAAFVSRETLWQTWATDPDTFVSKPDPSRCVGPQPPVDHCPVWPGAGPRFDEITEITQQGLFNLPDAAGIEHGETVHRNRASFEYIVSNNLWYREGIQAAQASQFLVSFPRGAVEIKAGWAEIQPSDKDRYHWVQITADGETKLFGLNALHLMTKALPNWTWATFEHVDNPGRCDFAGCRDDFGVVPRAIPPRNDGDQGAGQVYAAGQLTNQLSALFEAVGVDPVFLNYRLNGSQNTFTTPEGVATLLGNSVLEAGIKDSSSCMTCHVRSAYDDDGKFLPVVTEADGTKRSFNGTPDPCWFFTQDTCENALPFEERVFEFLPMDFVYGFIKAQPLAQGGTN